MTVPVCTVRKWNNGLGQSGAGCSYHLYHGHHVFIIDNHTSLKLRSRPYNRVVIPDKSPVTMMYLLHILASL